METLCVMPVGCRFEPTDVELIRCYLYNKVYGKPLPCHAVIDCDIYGDDDSWKKLLDNTKESCIYVFTKLRKKNTTSKRAERTTNYGVWKCQNEIYIYDENYHIGAKRNFSFYENKEIKKTAGKWTMHEYRLDGCLSHPHQEESYVLARINKKSHGRLQELKREENINERRANERSTLSYLNNNEVPQPKYMQPNVMIQESEREETINICPTIGSTPHLNNTAMNQAKEVEPNSYGLSDAETSNWVDSLIGD